MKKSILLKKNLRNSTKLLIKKKGVSMNWGAFSTHYLLLTSIKPLDMSETLFEK